MVNDEILGCSLHGFHEEAEDEEGRSAGSPLATVLGLQGLGEEFEYDLHFTEDEPIDEGLDLTSEHARGYEGRVLGHEARLESKDGFGGYAEVPGHDVVHGVDGQSAFDHGGLLQSVSFCHMMQ